MGDVQFAKMKKTMQRNYQESFAGALACFNEWLEKNGHQGLSVQEQRRVALEAGIDTDRWRQYRKMVEYQINEMSPKFLWRQIESINATLDEFWKLVREDLKFGEQEIKKALCDALDLWVRNKSDDPEAS